MEHIDRFINIFLIIIIILIVYYFIKEGITKYEKFTSDLPNNESINNIASVYNNDLMTVTNLKVTGSFNLLPKGVIVAWNGTHPPDGWTICDGTNGTPDLRDKFILGSGPKFGATGLTGGESEHVLTVDELPSHNHEFTSFTSASGHCQNPPCGTMNTDRGPNRTDKPAQSGNNLLSISMTGGNKPHNNMPPYFILTYIMKL